MSKEPNATGPRPVRKEALGSTVIVVGVNHVNEFYRVKEGYKNRHRRFGAWLLKSIPGTPIAIIEERGASGKKEADVAAGVEGSVAKDFAGAKGVPHVFADTDPKTYVDHYDRTPSDKLPEPARGIVLADRERCIAEAAARAGRSAPPDRPVVVICGWEHLEGIAKLLETRGFDVRREHLEVLGIHHVDPFDVDD